MFNVKHDRCNKKVSKNLEEITQGYDLYCIHCDEDLMPSECYVVSPIGDINLLNVMDTNIDSDLRILQDYGSKEFRGCIENVLSSVTYDNPVDVAIYYWAMVKGLN